MENDRLNEIRELNPDYDISMHKLNVYVCNNNTIYLLGSDAGIHHVTEDFIY